MQKRMIINVGMESSHPDNVAIHIPFATTADASFVSSAKWADASYLYWDTLGVAEQVKSVHSGQATKKHTRKISTLPM